MLTRRSLLQAAVESALAATKTNAQGQAGGAPIGNVPSGKYKISAGVQVPRRELGRKGERVSIVGLGGYHLGFPTEQESIQLVRMALDHGLNFLDNCWDYNGGESERRWGRHCAMGIARRRF
jgi:hypothetical protein